MNSAEKIRKFSNASVTSGKSDLFPNCFSRIAEISDDFKLFLTAFWSKLKAKTFSPTTGKFNARLKTSLERSVSAS